MQRRQRLAAAAEALARERLRQAEDDAAKTASSYWPSDAMPTREQNAAALKVGRVRQAQRCEAHLLGLRLGRIYLVGQAQPRLTRQPAGVLCVVCACVKGLAPDVCVWLSVCGRDTPNFRFSALEPIHTHSLSIFTGSGVSLAGVSFRRFALRSLRWPTSLVPFADAFVRDRSAWRRSARSR